jgi:hypothetical protein
MTKATNAIGTAASKGLDREMRVEDATIVTAKATAHIVDE